MRCLSVVLLLSALASCQSANKIHPDLELAVGETLTRQVEEIYSTEGIPEDVSEYVEHVGSRVVKAYPKGSRITTDGWSFRVLDTAAWMHFSSPDRTVFVSRGLLEALGDEAQLQAVLAHEVAHVVHGHVLDRVATVVAPEGSASGVMASGTASLPSYRSSSAAAAAWGRLAQMALSAIQLRVPSEGSAFRFETDEEDAVSDDVVRTVRALGEGRDGGNALASLLLFHMAAFAGGYVGSPDPPPALPTGEYGRRVLEPLSALSVRLRPNDAVRRTLDEDLCFLLGQRIKENYGGALASPEVRGYVASVGLSMVDVMGLGGGGMPWVFEILDSDERLHLSTPNRHVYLSRGVLEYVVANEAQLAAVLAHEILHVENGDVDRLLQPVILDMGRATMRLVLESVSPEELEAEMRRLRARAFRALGFDDEGEGVVRLSFSKSAETRIAEHLADRMHEGGYPPTELLLVMRSLRESSASSSGVAVHAIDAELLLSIGTRVVSIHQGSWDSGKARYEQAVLHPLELLSDKRED